MEASDPAASAWVAANAGSGKTHVLAQRVIRLLLDGVEPGAHPLHHLHQGRRRQHGEPRVRHAALAGPRSTTPSSIAAIRRDVERAPRRRAARAGAPAVRAGAGDAGRAQGADHPRLLHAAAAPVSVRGQCRRAFRGARRGGRSAVCSSRSASACCSNAANAPDGALGRALATAIAAAADQTFKEVVAEAIRKRDLVRAWIAARRQHRRGDRRPVRARWGSAPTRRSRQVRGRDRRRPATAGLEWMARCGALRSQAARRSASRPSDCAPRPRRAGRRAPTPYLRMSSSTGQGRAARQPV